MSEGADIDQFISRRMPDPNVRNAMLGLLADIITDVDAVNDQVWCLSFRNRNQLRLNIGNLEAFSTSSDRPDAWFMVIVRRPDADSFVRKHGVPSEQFVLEPFKAGFAAEDDIERFALPAEYFVEQPDELREMWRTAASILARKYKRTNKYRSHSREGVEAISTLLQRNLPQPKYPVGIQDPVQALYDELSDEGKAAVDALPDDLFTDDEGVDHAERFAKAIQIAHEHGDQIWSLYNSGRFTALNVQRYNVITLNRQIHLIVQPTLLDSSIPLQEFQSLVSWTDYPENLEIVQVKVDSSTPIATVESLDRINQQVIAQMAGADWKKNAQARHHADAARVKLALLTGEPLPAPSYFPREYYGMLAPSEIPQEHVPQNLRGTLAEQFAAVGLKYTDEQIASFYTALQTKGFVILSGISGTGKSKIAQRFADLLPTATSATTSSLADDSVTDGHGDSYSRVTVRDYMGKFHRFHIPVSITAGLPLPERGTAFNVPLSIDGVDGEARIRVRTSSGAYLIPKGRTRSEFVSLVRSHSAFYLRFRLNGAGDLIESVSISRERPEDTPSFTVRMTAAAIRDRLIGFPLSEVDKFPFPVLEPSVKISVQLPTLTVEGRLENHYFASGGKGMQLALSQLSKGFVDQLQIGEELVVTPIVRDGIVAEIRIDQSAPNTPGAANHRNHLFLPVRPDWRDGKPLIGYHNPLSGEYVRTEFLDFVLAVADDFSSGGRNAYFVILDEMNLAHVEYYFADVLSVIESGRYPPGHALDGWTVEGIPLTVGDEDVDLPRILRLPPNLYIIGTVNMDETTHPFSPKVLDRAFTIELTEVDFNEYPRSFVEGEGLGDGEKQALLDAFTRSGRYPRIDKEEIAKFVAENDRFRADLQRLNAELRKSRLHFGYRIFDEVMQFVVNAESNRLFTTEEAFDHAVLMKVLPKFNGSRGKLQNALFALLQWCHTGDAPSVEARQQLESHFASYVSVGTAFDNVVEVAPDSWRYPATGKRAALMMQDLYTDGFASFG